MTARGIRSAVARLVVVAALAVTLLVGSVALGSPQGASAAKYNCTQLIALGDANMTMGNVFYGLGDMVNAARYYGKAEGYYSSC